MRIACCIYVLFALSFVCAVSADESGDDTKKLAKKVRKNFKMINLLGTRATNLEYGDVVLDDKVGKLNEDLSGAVVQFDAQVTNLKENITSHLEDQDGEIEKLILLIEDLMKFNDIFGGYEYAFIETKKGWDYHEAAAISWGGHLASVHSEAENDFIVKRMLEFNDFYPWIGGQRISNTPTDGSANAWKWSDGTNWDYSAWKTGEPNRANENFVCQRPTGWYDCPFTYDLGGVYKRPYPKFNDIFGGYEYAFIETKKGWDYHEAAAISWGGHLASVHSEAENDFIAKRLLEFNDFYPYLGGQRISNTPTDGSATGWKWSDGTNWDYSAWEPGQPSIADEKVIRFLVGGWHDYPTSIYLGGGVYKRPYP